MTSQKTDHRRLRKAPAVTLLAAAIGAAWLTLPATASAVSLKDAAAEETGNISAAALSSVKTLMTAQQEQAASKKQQTSRQPAPAATPNDLPRGQFHLPDEGDVIGKHYTIVVQDQEQTLVDIARQHNIGYEEIRMANPGVSLWVPGKGTEVTIPSRYLLPDAPRKGIIINLSELRLYSIPPTNRASSKPTRSASGVKSSPLPWASRAPLSRSRTPPGHRLPPCVAKPPSVAIRRLKSCPPGRITRWGGTPSCWTFRAT